MAMKITPSIMLGVAGTILLRVKALPRPAATP
jgi:hypothetical protein